MTDAMQVTRLQTKWEWDRQKMRKKNSLLESEYQNSKDCLNKTSETDKIQPSWCRETGIKLKVGQKQKNVWEKCIGGKSERDGGTPRYRKVQKSEKTYGKKYKIESVGGPKSSR